MGMEAMKIMPKKYVLRSRIALKTAEYIIERNENLSLLEKCHFIAYESDTSATNYLRALLNGYGTEEKRKNFSAFLRHYPGTMPGILIAYTEVTASVPSAEKINRTAI